MFIDQVFADVVAGTATAALSRPGTGPSSPSYDVGTIVFGDNTNDSAFGGPYFNSAYTVDFVMFEDLSRVVVPEPTTACWA